MTELARLRRRGAPPRMNDYFLPSPLLADAPSLQLAEFKSANHGGGGQNVLYQDQSVRYQTDCTVPGLQDHLFLNTAGMPAAGRGQLDAVLGRSEATPGVVPVVHVRATM